MRKILALAAAVFVTMPLYAKRHPYQDKSHPIEERVADLVGRMTLDEKLAQLTQLTLGLNTNANNINDPTKPCLAIN